MAGAFTVVFKTTVLESYVMSLVPAIVLIVVCTYAKPSTQIIVATIASACYAIVMTIVLVGTVGTAIEGGLTSPNVVFLCMLVIIYFIAALLHPEEFACDTWSFILYMYPLGLSCLNNLLPVQHACSVLGYT